MNEIYLLQDFQTTIFPFYLYVKTRHGRESGRLMRVTMTNTVMTLWSRLRLWRSSPHLYDGLLSLFHVAPLSLSALIT